MEIADIGRSLAAFVVVMGLIALVAFAAKRWLPQLQASGNFPSRRLKLVETMVLDTRNRLILVQLDGRELLIGLGQNGPTLLKEHEPPAKSAPGQLA